MNNTMNIFQAIANPQAFVNQAMQNSQLMSNPIMSNAVSMAQKGDMKGLETLVNNVAKQKGTSVEEIRKMLGI